MTENGSGGRGFVDQTLTRYRSMVDRFFGSPFARRPIVGHYAVNELGTDGKNG